MLRVERLVSQFVEGECEGVCASASVAHSHHLQFIVIGYFVFAVVIEAGKAPEGLDEPFIAQILGVPVPMGRTGGYATQNLARGSEEATTAGGSVVACCWCHFLSFFGGQLLAGCQFRQARGFAGTY